MSEHLDCVVVGAGVIGLAIARSLAMSGRDVVVLESEPHIGMHTSSRNSEVIHAGLYYPENSLKATLCVRGREMLYAYCRDRQINHQHIGKLIVAPSDSELGGLMSIKSRAEKCGVNDLILLGSEEIHEREPNVTCCGGLFSPSTGIVDSHELMLALVADIELQGGSVVCNSRVTNLRSEGASFVFDCSGEKFSCNTLVNSAGLWAQELVQGLPIKNIPQRHLAKAHYFAYQGKSPFRHLVYPLPTDGGLGIHATNDLSGAARFGPDVTWVDAVDYEFDEGRKAAFVEAIKNYFPDLDAGKLTPAYTGIRPKLAGRGAQFTDFNIQFEVDHGVPGLVTLYGIESPGLTACLAIGDFIKHKL